jgi:hypothetical protein
MEPFLSMPHQNLGRCGLIEVFSMTGIQLV